MSQPRVARIPCLLHKSITVISSSEELAHLVASVSVENWIGSDTLENAQSTDYKYAKRMMSSLSPVLELLRHDRAIPNEW